MYVYMQMLGGFAGRHMQKVKDVTLSSLLLQLLLGHDTISADRPEGWCLAMAGDNCVIVGAHSRKLFLPTERCTILCTSIFAWHGRGWSISRYRTKPKCYLFGYSAEERV